MYRLNLPDYEIKLRSVGGKSQIFDFLRRKFVALTPEEWVRQHFVHYLVEHLDYPQTLIANEVELSIGQKKLRCDSVVYSRKLQPLMIVEYKAPTVALSQKTFNQVAAYNLLLRVDFLVVSNGLQHFCCRMNYERASYAFLKEIPRYEEILS